MCPYIALVGNMMQCSCSTEITAALLLTNLHVSRMTERAADMTGSELTDWILIEYTSSQSVYGLYVGWYMCQSGSTAVQCLSNQNVTNNVLHYWPLGENHWSSCTYWCCSLFMMRHRRAGKHLSSCGEPNNWALVITEWNSTPNGRTNPVLHDTFWNTTGVNLAQRKKRLCVSVCMWLDAAFV